MKFSLTPAALLALACTLSLGVATAVPALSSFRGKHVVIGGLLAESRRLEDGEEDEYGFLADYTITFLKCVPGLTSTNEDGETQYSAVVYRLCPSSGDCDNGCSSGYGDYLVGINTFVDHYTETQKDDRRLEEEEFNVDEYTECGAYNVENNDGGRRKLEEEAAAYYIGPACTEDGDDIKLALFSEYTCVTESDVDFEDVSGSQLPYYNGGLTPSSCTSLVEVNDNGEYEVDGQWEEIVEDSSACETLMESYSAVNGKDESECENIAMLTYVKSSGSAGKVVLWMVAIGIVGGGVYWYIQQDKQTGSNSASLVQNDGVVA